MPKSWLETENVGGGFFFPRKKDSFRGKKKSIEWTIFWGEKNALKEIFLSVLVLYIWDIFPKQAA